MPLRIPSCAYCIVVQLILGPAVSCIHVATRCQDHLRRWDLQSLLVVDKVVLAEQLYNPHMSGVFSLRDTLV